MKKYSRITFLFFYNSLFFQELIITSFNNPLSLCHYPNNSPKALQQNFEILLNGISPMIKWSGKTTGCFSRSPRASRSFVPLHSSGLGQLDVLCPGFQLSPSWCMPLERSRHFPSWIRFSLKASSRRLDTLGLKSAWSLPGICWPEEVGSFHNPRGKSRCSTFKKDFLRLKNREMDWLG